MSLDLYLAVVDSTGAPVYGGATVDGLRNPLRGNATVTKPFEVSAWSFTVDAPFSSGAPGKADPSELVVDLPYEYASAVLFRAIAAGRRFKSIDVIALEAVGGRNPVVTFAVGIATAALTEVAWTGNGDGITRRLKIDGQIFSIGSASQRIDGTYDPFAFSTYNVATGASS